MSQFGKTYKVYIKYELLALYDVTALFLKYRLYITTNLLD
jgi:hypothetical protein